MQRPWSQFPVLKRKKKGINNRFQWMQAAGAPLIVALGGVVVKAQRATQKDSRAAGTVPTRAGAPQTYVLCEGRGLSQGGTVGTQGHPGSKGK